MDRDTATGCPEISNLRACDAGRARLQPTGRDRAHRRRARQSVVGLAAALTAGALAGCSPTYDWREIADDEAGMRVLLPGQPAEHTRALRLDGLPLTMTMRTVQAGDTAFAVGCALLPDDEPSTRERVLASLRAALVRNIGGHESASRAIAIPVLDRSGREVGRLNAQAIEAEGRVGDAPAHLLARFAARGRRAWQWVVLGPSPDAGQAVTFLESARVID